MSKDWTDILKNKILPATGLNLFANALFLKFN